ncbi:MAG: hypothetical protein ACTSQB_06805, partial [Candidatus Heimdallarchaeota archaeon]
MSKNELKLKRKILFVLMTVILCASVFVTIAFIEKPQIQETTILEENGMDNEIQTTAPPNPETDTEILDTETWYLGESVNTTIEFNNQLPSTHTVSMEIYYNHPIIIDSSTIGSVSKARSDDGDYWDIIAYCNETTGSFYYYVDFLIYCGGSGTLNLEAYQYIWTNGFGSSGTDNTIATLSVTSDMLNIQGFLHLYVEILATSAVGGDSFTVNYLDYSDMSLVVILNPAVTKTWSTSIEALGVGFDRCYFERDTIINCISSYYQYASATQIIHRIEIPSVLHAKGLNIYYPITWTYLSINPYASVTDSAYILTINSPTELTYSVLFSSNSSYFLTIKDISTDYFYDLSFEDEVNFLIDDYGDYPDSVNISTSVVQSGYYSLEIEDSGTKYLTFPDKKSSGEYYLSLWYYIEEIGTNTNDFLFYYKDTSDTWVNVEIFNKDTSTNRWFRFTVFFKTGDSADEEMFKLSFIDNVKFYIDNIWIGQTSTTIVTSKPSENLITTELHAWDGRKNPTMPNSQVNFQLYNRTNSDSLDALIFKTSAITNAYGIATINYNVGLEHKEYLLMDFSPESTFSVIEDTKEDYADLS